VIHFNVTVVSRRSRVATANSLKFDLARFDFWRE
jgi:hypothetical protein